MGDSQAHGDAERVAQSVQSIARTLKEALEISIGAEVPETHDVMTWLVEHAAIILNLFKRSHGGDHLTAFYSLRGRHWRIPLPEFGETLKYKRTWKATKLNKFGRRNDVGVFIGLNGSTSKRIVWDVDDHRIHFTQTVYRRPVETRWNRDYVMSINCTPWRYNAAGLDEFGLLKPVNIGHIERPDVPKLRPLA